MSEKDVQAQIEERREAIDKMDCQVVQLLNQRAKLALEIRELKPQVKWGLYDPKREEQIFANLNACNEGPLYGDNLRDIYETILHVMKEL